MKSEFWQIDEIWYIAVNSRFQLRNRLRQGESRGRREIFLLKDGRKYPMPCPMFGIIKTARMEHERADGAEKDGSK
jgi:hypothetical protein